MYLISVDCNCTLGELTGGQFSSSVNCCQWDVGLEGTTIAFTGDVTVEFGRARRYFNACNKNQRTA
jgi:hypothetical protein